MSAEFKIRPFRFAMEDCEVENALNSISESGIKGPTKLPSWSSRKRKSEESEADAPTRATRYC